MKSSIVWREFKVGNLHVGQHLNRFLFIFPWWQIMKNCCTSCCTDILHG
jgi:hypothetical protein